jgi:8-oxo-dGTP pyrophosphatase MutT (NUDIX family)
MLRSRHGDYKFPGGGVDPDDPISAALARELREECGLDDVTVGDLVFTTMASSETAATTRTYPGFCVRSES